MKGGRGNKREILVMGERNGMEEEEGEGGRDWTLNKRRKNFKDGKVCKIGIKRLKKRGERTRNE